MEFVFALPFLFLPLLFPWLAGQMAKSFGRKFWPWFILGSILPILTNIILLCLPDKSKKKQSPEAVENGDLFKHLFENENVKELRPWESQFPERA